MSQIPSVNTELMKYAEQLRNENAILSAEVKQLRNQMRNHIDLSEKRFREIYACIENNNAMSHSNNAVEDSSSSHLPFMQHQSSSSGPSLSSALYR